MLSPSQTGGGYQECICRHVGCWVSITERVSPCELLPSLSETGRRLSFDSLTNVASRDRYVAFIGDGRQAEFQTTVV